ncbi:UDP-2,3-diacylglucosamine diphosphatase [Hahella ganghwensis]|uniref:UDP-2,3-diacylglucosamine diphosphatase n=1 Tax=Hahella ganghwensis TaxID=286420 RepID=UPI0003648232|nr:UDP-2,3-diacylglucosamine diphosphatase [Hahella ganghwensis]
MQTSYRAVFISDVHLGTPACQAHHLLDFLKKVETLKLYLVGDIVDLQEMRRKAHFPEVHRQIISTVMKKAREGTEVVYIPGNHDAFFRQMSGQVFAGIKIKLNASHETCDGRTFHVSHGDEFDQMVKLSPLMLAIGDRAHSLMLKLNGWVNGMRRLMGLPYWSFAGYLKSHLSKAQQFIERFELAALKAASGRTVDGFICGHIHFASFRLKNGKLYCNDGDWVEHCTALVENYQGELNIIHWSEQPRWIASEPRDSLEWEGKPVASE